MKDKKVILQPLDLKQTFEGPTIFDKVFHIEKVLPMTYDRRAPFLLTLSYLLKVNSKERFIFIFVEMDLCDRVKDTSGLKSSSSKKA